MSNSEALDELFRRADAGLEAVQELQRRYDEVGWRIEEPSWAKVRHVLLHLTKINAQIAKLVEKVEHAEDEGSPPTSAEFARELSDHANLGSDLLFHAAQFANLSGYSLSEELRRLYRTNSARFAPNSPFATLGVSPTGERAGD